MTAKVYELSRLHDKSRVFRDRDDAGGELLKMLRPYYEKAENTLVIAIPSGGVPVGLAVAQGLDLGLDLIIVRKIPIPGNTEAGFGAVTLEGEVFFNDELLKHLQLSKTQIKNQIATVKTDLSERNHIFRKDNPFPDLTDKTIIITDDGLASGYTMLACVETIRQKGAHKIAVAVPSAPRQSISRISSGVEEIFCPNIRTGPSFAVAAAYENWYDLDRNEVLTRLREAGH